MTDQDHIDRIDALTRYARNTWFTLLAALVFVSVTLMGVEHIDFYGVDRATKLPVVGVDVPTRSFFFAAPILIAAIYGYFHLYLIRLWDALSAAPSRVEGIRLGDAIAPWLITDAALHFRRKARRDNCTTPRTLESGAMLLNFSLSWGFGLVVLWFLWSMSWPARTFFMASIAGVSLGVSIVSGASSLAMMGRRMNRAPTGVTLNLWGTWAQIIGLVIGTGSILYISNQKTAGSAEQLAGLSMANENIVGKPPGWLPYRIDRASFLAVWCNREAVTDCRALDNLEEKFEDELFARRSTAVGHMRRPGWAKLGKYKPDFRGADLTLAFLSGASLQKARMQGADLTLARMEGTDLTFAQMQGADLISTQMQGAILVGAQMQGAFLFDAQMQRAWLMNAQMQGASLHMANLQRADLSSAQMQEAVLSEAQMQGAKLDYSQLTGTQDRPSVLDETDLGGVSNDGGMLRFVDLRPAIFDEATDFRNSFLDGSVMMTEAFRFQMGGLCQQAKKSLEDAEFYAGWRGWIEAAPEPRKWRFMPVPDAYRTHPSTTRM